MDGEIEVNVDSHRTGEGPHPSNLWKSLSCPVGARTSSRGGTSVSRIAHEAFDEVFGGGWCGGGDAGGWIRDDGMREQGPGARTTPEKNKAPEATGSGRRRQPRTTGDAPKESNK